MRVLYISQVDEVNSDDTLASFLAPVAGTRNQDTLIGKSKTNMDSDLEEDDVVAAVIA